MNAITSYSTSVVQAKTGLSRGVLIGYATEAVLALMTAILGLIAIFFIFTDWLGLGATATSTGMFLVCQGLLLSSIVWTKRAKRGTAENAHRMLIARTTPVLLSPPVLKAGGR